MSRQRLVDMLYTNVRKSHYDVTMSLRAVQIVRVRHYSVNCSSRQTFYHCRHSNIPNRFIEHLRRNPDTSITTARTVLREPSGAYYVYQGVTSGHPYQSGWMGRLWYDLLHQVKSIE